MSFRHVAYDAVEDGGCDVAEFTVERKREAVGSRRCVFGLLENIKNSVEGRGVGLHVAGERFLVIFEVFGAGVGVRRIRLIGECAAAWRRRTDAVRSSMCLSGWAM